MGIKGSYFVRFYTDCAINVLERSLTDLILFFTATVALLRLRLNCFTFKSVLSLQDQLETHVDKVSRCYISLKVPVGLHLRPVQVTFGHWTPP